MLRSVEPALGVNRRACRDQSTCRVQIATGPGVVTPSEVAADRAVVISGSGPSPRRGVLPFFQVQPARRLRTCAKAKKTYRGLDKESLTQSRVFPMERWSKSRESRDRANRRVQLSGRDGLKGRNQVATHRAVALRPSQHPCMSRSVEPALGVNRREGRDQSTCRVQIATGPGVTTPSKVATDRAVAISGSGPSPRKVYGPLVQVSGVCASCEASCEAWWAGNWALSAHRSYAYEPDKGVHCVLNVTALVVVFTLPLFGSTSTCAPRVVRRAGHADVDSGKATASYVAFRAVASSTRPREVAAAVLQAIRWFGGVFGALSPRGRRVERGRRRAVFGLSVPREAGNAAAPSNAAVPSLAVAPSATVATACVFVEVPSSDLPLLPPVWGNFDSFGKNPEMLLIKTPMKTMVNDVNDDRVYVLELCFVLNLSSVAARLRVCPGVGTVVVVVSERRLNGCGLTLMVLVPFMGTYFSWYMVYQPFQVLWWSCAPWSSCGLAVSVACGDVVADLYHQHLSCSRDCVSLYSVGVCPK
ncbi:hypothetical protein Taro_048560 [Colocasia esculenta]|uniref:Uncharacterized protein n=1 Tax=Colocasia esculenta TaxID=4460 RepID=A0A843X8G6_COLES|nr:hypothetical protein [Colocasia esculenta]